MAQDLSNAMALQNLQQEMTEGMPLPPPMEPRRRRSRRGLPEPAAAEADHSASGSVGPKKGAAQALQAAGAAAVAKAAGAVAEAEAAGAVAMVDPYETFAVAEAAVQGPEKKRRRLREKMAPPPEWQTEE